MRFSLVREYDRRASLRDVFPIAWLGVQNVRHDYRRDVVQKRMMVGEKAQTAMRSTHPAPGTEKDTANGICRGGTILYSTQPSVGELKVVGGSFILDYNWQRCARPKLIKLISECPWLPAGYRQKGPCARLGSISNHIHWQPSFNLDLHN